MSDHTPRYISVKNQIMELIGKETLIKNGRLPSEDELASIFNVSRTTVRSALQSLEAEGIIEKRHGSGNFVRLQDWSTSKNAMFTMLHYDNDAEPVIVDCKLRHILLTPPIAQKLGEEPCTKALEITKHFSDRGTEDSCIVEQIPLHYLKVMPTKEIIPESVYIFIARFCGLDVKEITTNILAVAGSESPFKSIRQPVLKLEEIFTDTNGQNILYSEYYMNTSHVRPQIIRGKPPQFWRIK